MKIVPLKLCLGRKNPGQGEKAAEGQGPSALSDTIFRRNIRRCRRDFYRNMALMSPQVLFSACTGLLQQTMSATMLISPGKPKSCVSIQPIP